MDRGDQKEVPRRRVVGAPWNDLYQVQEPKRSEWDIVEDFKEYLQEIKKNPALTHMTRDYAELALPAFSRICDDEYAKSVLEEDSETRRKMVILLTKAVQAVLDPIKKLLAQGKDPDWVINEYEKQIISVFGAMTNFAALNLPLGKEDVPTYDDLLRTIHPLLFDRAYEAFTDLPFGFLVNFTRRSNTCELYVDSDFLKVTELVARSVDFSPGSPQLPGIMEVLQNLSQCEAGRKAFFDSDVLEKVLFRLKPNHSGRVRIAVSGILKNISFEDVLQDRVIDESSDVLAYTLGPIFGTGEYDETEVLEIPPLLSCDIMEKSVRERDPERVVRLHILEFLYRLCRRRGIRESLRKQGVYYILREYHNWEQDESLLDLLERVVNLLIQTEEEIGVEDLGELAVTAE